MKKGSKASVRQALYRKYRSRSLSDIVGQQHVTNTLKAAIKSDNISHAYLFSGPRGVGKTSIARILAYQINNIPYDENSNHLDIIEIDAASNRRVDDIRDLRSKVNIAPSSAKYKVYIIDEVHMLTKESFNALLKTLEEPPAHAVFILATTEAHKLPATIISRTQHYQFRAIADNEISQHLAEVSAKEGIKIDKAALDLIAKASLGGMRDALSLLDQLSNSTDKIDLAQAEQFMGLAPKIAVKNLIKNIQANDLSAVADTFNNIVESGADIHLVISQLYAQLKDHMLASKNSSTVSLMEDLLQINDSYDPKIALEVVLFKHTVKDDADTRKQATAAPNQTNRKAASKQAKVEINQPVQTVVTKELEQAAELRIEIPSSEQAFKTSNASIDSDKWQQVINEIKQTNNTLAGLLRQVVAEINSTTILIFCPYSFHVKRMETAKYQKTLGDAITKIFGDNLVFEISQNSSKFTQKGSLADQVVKDDTSILAVKNLMGGEIINV